MKECPNCFCQVDDNAEKCPNCDFDFVEDKVVADVNVPEICKEEIDITKPEIDEKEDYDFSVKICIVTAVLTAIIANILEVLIIVKPPTSVGVCVIWGLVLFAIKALFIISCIYGIVNSKLIKIGKRLDNLEKNEKFKEK
ncbi:MAG: hypothetical protein RSA24_03555 [Clostridia bacterium]